MIMSGTWERNVGNRLGSFRPLYYSLQNLGVGFRVEVGKKIADPSLG